MFARTATLVVLFYTFPVCVHVCACVCARGETWLILLRDEVVGMVIRRTWTGISSSGCGSVGLGVARGNLSKEFCVEPRALNVVVAWNEN